MTEHEFSTKSEYDILKNIVSRTSLLTGAVSLYVYNSSAN